MVTTYCCHWTDSVGEKIECDDVAAGESHSTTRLRVLRRAKARMDAGETPLDGTDLWMEKLVDSFATVIAEETIAAPWQGSFADFVIECVEAP